MPFPRTLALVSVVTALLAVFFWQPVSRYLFHPDGLSLADGEICMENASGESVIAEISIFEGAKTTELLGNGETVCSPSRAENANGVIRVGKSEGKPPFCELSATTGTSNILKRFSPPDNCEWQA